MLQPSPSGAGRGTFASYITGFVLAVALTLIAFILVMSKALSFAGTTVAIFSAAVVQVVVHLHYFLHLDTSSTERWNVMALLFTGTVLFILVGGSLWIMFNLHDRTMLF